MDNYSKETYPILDKVYKLKSGFFFAFPSENECHIKKNKWTDSEVKLVDPEKKEWVRTFFTKLDGKTTVQELLRNVPEHRVKQMTNLLASLEKTYIYDTLVSKLKAENLDTWWFHLIGQRKTANHFYIDTLQASKLLVIGAGVIGTRVAVNLAQLDIAQITILDIKKVSAEDRLNHPCYAYVEEGDPRSEVVANFLNKWTQSTRMRGLYLTREDRQEYIINHSQEFDLVIVCEDNFEPALLETVNTITYQNQTRWSMIMIDGWHVYIGPTFIPTQSGCYNCLMKYRQSNLNDPTDIEKYIESIAQDKHVSPYRPSPLLADTAAGMFVSDLPNLVGRMPERIENESSLTLGRQLHFDARSYDATFIHVTKIPKCDVCSANSKQEAIYKYETSNQG